MFDGFRLDRVFGDVTLRSATGEPGRRSASSTAIRGRTRRGTASPRVLAGPLGGLPGPAWLRRVHDRARRARPSTGVEAAMAVDIAGSCSPGTRVVRCGRARPRRLCRPSDGPRLSRPPYRLVILDAVPIGEALAQRALFAQPWWHWFFFAQPDTPGARDPGGPRALVPSGPAPHGWRVLQRLPAGDPRPRRPSTRCSRTTGRASASTEQLTMLDMRRGRTVACPTLVLWASRDDMELLYGNPARRLAALDRGPPWPTHRIGASHG